MSCQDFHSWFARRQGRSQKARRSQSFSKSASSQRHLRVEKLEDRRLLAVFSVSNLDNTGAGSLREAINMANSAAGPDEITFDVGVVGTINTESQLPAIFDALTITGPGQTLLTIDAGDGTDNNFGTGDGYRIFRIDDLQTFNKIDVTISGLTLTGGDTINGVDDSNVNSSGLDGGAILSQENLTLINSTVTGNSTGSGGRSENDGYGSGNGGSGGGIASLAGNLTILGSTISGNTTGNGGEGGDGYSYGGIGGFGGNGGGVFAQENTVIVITGSTISGNSTGDGGNGGDVFGSGGPYGGVYAGDGGNGGGGGGIANRGTRLTISGSTISGNTTGNGGDPGYGGDANAYPGQGGFGGGIESERRGSISDLIITGSTLSGNTATSLGGGLFNNTLTTISSSTITANTGSFGGGIVNTATITLESTIVAKNTAVVSGPDVNSTVFGSSSVSGTFNLIGDDTDLTGIMDGVDGNQIGTSGIPIVPLLGLLTNNGGPTETHALLAGSPAIDTGSSTETFDQRGTPFSRDEGNGVDIGALELQGAPSTDSADFDTDGDVDGTDFLAWQRGFGTLAPNALEEDGDANNDQAVDAVDLGIWQLQFGQPVPLLELSAVSTQPSAQANLIDAALATEWLGDAKDAEGSMFVEKDIAVELAFANYSDPNQTELSAAAKTANQALKSPTNSAESKQTDEPWLSDDLIEQVFG